LDELLKAATLTERQRLLQKYVPGLTSAILLGDAFKDLNTAYSTVSRWKGLWVETARQEARRDDLPQDARRELETIRARLSKVYSTGIFDDKSQEQISVLLSRKDEVERRYGAGMAVSAGVETNRPTDTSRLKAVLRDDEALVDIYRVSAGDKKAYKVFVLTKVGEMTAIQLNGDDVEQRVQEWLSIARSGGDATASWSLLKKALWQPLTVAMPEWVRRIAIIPDGVLLFIPWQVFEVDDRGHVITQFA